MKSIRWIPKVRYTNFRKEFPTMGANCFTKWFSIDRFWSGKIVKVSVKHHCLTLDFRKDWVADLING